MCCGGQGPDPRLLCPVSKRCMTFAFYFITVCVGSNIKFLKCFYCSVDLPPPAWRTVTVPWPPLSPNVSLTVLGGLALPPMIKSLSQNHHYRVLSPGAREPTELPVKLCTGRISATRGCCFSAAGARTVVHGWKTPGSLGLSCSEETTPDVVVGAFLRGKATTPR